MRWFYNICDEVNLDTKKLSGSHDFLRFNYLVKTPGKTDKGGADE